MCRFLIIAIFLTIYSTNIFAGCDAFDDKTNSCRYPAGDSWCQKNVANKPFAYMSNCKNSNSQPKNTEVEVVEETTNTETSAQCSENGVTQLFDVYLVCAKRSVFRTAIKSKYNSPKRENNSYIADIYYSTLPKTDELMVVYTNDGHFAYAQYRFPTFMDVKLVTEVREMVQYKYGPPAYSNGNPRLGDVTYRWKQPDGIVIEVTRGWPETTTYLRYKHPTYYQQMEYEREINKIIEKSNQYQENFGQI